MNINYTPAVQRRKGSKDAPNHARKSLLVMLTVPERATLYDLQVTLAGPGKAPLSAAMALSILLNRATATAAA